MSIRVSCDCGKELTLKDEAAGQRVKCPACGQPISVEEPEAEDEEAEEEEETVKAASKRPAKKKKKKRAGGGGGFFGFLGGSLSANYKLFVIPLVVLLGASLVVGVVIVFFMWSAGMGTPWEKVELDRFGQMADGVERNAPGTSVQNPPIRGKAVVLRRVLTVGTEKTWEFSPIHHNLGTSIRGKPDDPVLTFFLIEFTGTANLGPPTEASVVVAYRDGTVNKTVANINFATKDGRHVEEQIEKWLMGLPRK